MYFIYIYMKEIKTSQYLIRLYFNEKITGIPLHFIQNVILWMEFLKDKMELLKH